jgi:hypothetical protein
LPAGVGGAMWRPRVSSVGGLLGPVGRVDGQGPPQHTEAGRLTPTEDAAVGSAATNGTRASFAVGRMPSALNDEMTCRHLGSARASL